MTYQTLLLHVDPTPRSSSRTQVAARLAQAHSAHLVGAAMTGVSRHVFGQGGFDPADPVFARQLGQLRDQGRTALKAFEASVAAAGVESFESRLLDDDVAGGITLQARYADLSVIGQFDPDHATPGLLPEFPGSVVLGSPGPVLVLPYAGGFDEGFSGRFRRPLVAWDGSLQASRAIHGALPLLAGAGQAEILIFNPDASANGHGQEPGADLALYLARHQIGVNVTQRHIDGDAGEALLSAAADFDADLIVMGAYGHARWREIVLGGVTRTVLQSMTAPVLMAH